MLAKLFATDNDAVLTVNGGKAGEGIEFCLMAIAVAILVIIKGSGAFSLDRFVFARYWAR